MLGGDIRPGWIAYDEFRAAAAPLAPLAPGDGASAADDALILYTSGSSARPKAVRLQHYAVIENGFNIGERMGLGPEDRVLLAPPLFWAYGACNALPATLSHGAALVLQERFDPRRMDRACRAAPLHRGLHVAEHYRRGVAASGIRAGSGSRACGPG